ncbi:MAG: ATP-dependent Clp protease proteolytic subunit [Xanthobacteraceae bacterium]
MSLVHPSPGAAQAPDQEATGSASIYNLDREAGTGSVAIDGPIDKAVASHAIELIKSLRPDVNDLTVVLNSSGGDVAAAMEIGEVLRGQWALTAVDDDSECVGACVFVLAAGVRRAPASDKIGIQRPHFDPKEFAGMSSDHAKQKYAALTKKAQTYLSRMGMSKKLFQDMMQQPSNKVLVLNAAQLKALGLEGSYAAYEEWLRTNHVQQAPQSN